MTQRWQGLAWKWISSRLEICFQNKWLIISVILLVIILYAKWHNHQSLLHDLNHDSDQIISSIQLCNQSRSMIHSDSDYIPPVLRRSLKEYHPLNLRKNAKNHHHHKWHAQLCNSGRHLPLSIDSFPVLLPIESSSFRLRSLRLSEKFFSVISFDAIQFAQIIW